VLRTRGLLGLSLAILVTSLGIGVWERLASDPDALLREHLAQGTRLLEGEEWEAAARELRLALPLADDSLRLMAHYNLGLGLLRLSEEDEGREARAWASDAVRQQEAALRIHPGHPEAAWNLELALRRLNRLESGVAARQEADAARLLTSLRLQEEGTLAELVRDRVRTAGEGTLPPERRGPPW
jgi:hypothetical protein